MLALSRGVLAMVAWCALADAKELTKATWREAFKGKTVFVMFHSPSCVHCREMRPAWNQLTSTWADTEKKILIAKVNCKGTGASLCEERKMYAFPTLLYGHDPDNLKEYDSDRAFVSLNSFAHRLPEPPVAGKSDEL